ncbi:hypothetical protein ACLB2K_067404 [Fragaria x ananassa]
MAKYPSNPLLLVALLCAFAAARINCLDQNGICKSLVETQGYTCQDHQVTTEDGYILGLQRIPSGKSSNNSTAQKLPVLLQHGLMGDAGSWLLNPPNQALAFILADKGFDVWLANARGTQASRGHKSLNNIDPAYWEWTWDQLAAYDLPAFFNYVNNHRTESTLCWPFIGNIVSASCLVTTKAEYHTKISSFALSSCLSGDSTPLESGNILLQGPNCCITPTSSNLLFQHIPQSTSTKNMVHMSQMIRRGTITMFDYVLPAINMQRYNQLTPPVYNMASIPKDVPLFFGYGGRDALSDVNDVKALLNDLRDHDKDKLVEQYIEEYAHMDFIMAGNANQKVYDPLLTFFGQN